MEHRVILLAGIVTTALFSISAGPAIADSYDDQAAETRALNIQALAAARGQSDAPMGAMGGVDAGDDEDGVGGPLFEAAPGPDDTGDETPESDAPDIDEPDVADEPEDAAPPL